MTYVHSYVYVFVSIEIFVVHGDDVLYRRQQIYLNTEILSSNMLYYQKKFSTLRYIVLGRTTYLSPRYIILTYI